MCFQIAKVCVIFMTVLSLLVVAIGVLYVIFPDRFEVAKHALSAQTPEFLKDYLDQYLWRNGTNTTAAL